MNNPIKSGYGSNKLLHGEQAELRVKTCPHEYSKDNEAECLDRDVCFQPHDLPVGTFYLPHSCNEWIIGTSEQAASLMEDIRLALEKNRWKPRPPDEKKP